MHMVNRADRTIRRDHNMDIEILYRDEYLFAVNKPSGLLVHRGWAKDKVTLVDLVKEMSGEQVVYPIHRIDRQTSGVVMFAANSESAAKFGEQLEEGTLSKYYVALVRGVISQEGIIDHPIPRKENGRRVPAITEFVKLQSAQTEPRHVSLVLAKPLTGRLHQVRRHFKHLSHPIIGDANYGKGPINREMRDRYGLERLALHAIGVAFMHPYTGKPLRIDAALPTDLVQPFAKMGIDWESVRRLPKILENGAI